MSTCMHFLTVQRLLVVLSRPAGHILDDKRDNDLVRRNHERCGDKLHEMSVQVHRVWLQFGKGHTCIVGPSTRCAYSPTISNIRHSSRIPVTWTSLSCTRPRPRACGRRNTHSKDCTPTASCVAHEGLLASVSANSPWPLSEIRPCEPLSPTALDRKGDTCCTSAAGVEQTSRGCARRSCASGELV